MEDRLNFGGILGALMLDFLYLFDLAVDSSSLIAVNYSASGKGIVWNPILKRNLHDWEIPTVAELLIRL